MELRLSSIDPSIYSFEPTGTFNPQALFTEFLDCENYWISEGAEWYNDMNGGGGWGLWDRVKG